MSLGRISVLGLSFCLCCISWPRTQTRLPLFKKEDGAIRSYRGPAPRLVWVEKKMAQSGHIVAPHSPHTRNRLPLCRKEDDAIRSYHGPHQASFFSCVQKKILRQSRKTFLFLFCFLLFFLLLLRSADKVGRPFCFCSVSYLRSA